MNGSSCDKLDSLISASLHINIADEAKAFLSQDISGIHDNPKLRRTVLRNAEREKPRARNIRLPYSRGSLPRRGAPASFRVYVHPEDQRHRMGLDR